MYLFIGVSINFSAEFVTQTRVTACVASNSMSFGISTSFILLGTVPGALDVILSAILLPITLPVLLLLLFELSFLKHF